MGTHAGWPFLPANQTPELAENEVHLWRARLDGGAAADLAHFLSAEEMDRAARFQFDIHRERFVAARGFLRLILSRYLRIDPQRLTFSYGEFGKPELRAESSHSRLRFNLSHSESLAIYAVARDRALGVDVEKMRAEFAQEQTATNFFSPREVAALRGLPREAWVEGFFNCWTRKEAYVKARGEGLSARLDQFDVSVAPGEPARLLKTFSGDGETGRWTLRSFCPQPGFVAALAVESRNQTIICRRWSLESEREEGRGDPFHPASSI